MATYHDGYRTYTFTDEARTLIAFPSDHAFAEYRGAIEQKYAASMVEVRRQAVYAGGRTIAQVDHASNLGAELRGLAVQFGGSSEDLKG